MKQKPILVNVPESFITSTCRIIIGIFILVFSGIVFNNCQKLERITGISSAGVDIVERQSAEFYLEIGDLSGQGENKYGFCWATHTEPVLSDSLVYTGLNAVAGERYSSSIGHLKTNTAYYMRAFIVENGQTFFSDEVRFSTLEANLPVVTGGSATNITGTTADCEAAIAGDGGSSIISAGFCYNTSGNPVVNDSVKYISVDGNAIVLKITGLLPVTRYYVRAFATNEAGISYGNVFDFTTSVDLPVVKTISVTQVTATHALIKGELINRGGPQLIDSGFFYSTTGDPNQYSDKLRFNHAGNFELMATQLPSNSTVFIRAFAQNSTGFGMGEVIKVKTASLTNDVSDYEGNSYKTARIGKYVWMTQNLRSTQYRDGTNIPNAVSYNNNEQNTMVLGKLYTWDAAMNQSTDTLTQGACPNGWHIPTTSEWNNLIDFYGGWQNAGFYMKDIQNGMWNELNENTNFNGDIAFPASGYRVYNGTTFRGLGTECYFWGSETSYKDDGMARAISAEAAANSYLSSYYYNKTASYSLRCVQNH